MGMDVYGRNPSSEIGEYFRANIWSWRPIHELIERSGVLSPRMLEDISYNDGAGPDAEDAERIADAIEKMIAGMDDEHVFMYTQEVQNDLLQKVSESLGGKVVFPDFPSYAVEVKHVREFVDFCRESGGFEVW